MANFSVIIPAAGASSRFGKTHLKKPYALIKNQAVWLYSAQQFAERKDVGQIIIVIAPDDEEYFRMKFNANIAVMDLTLVIGGKERADSVRNALSRVSAECDHVAIHDAARPCLRENSTDEVFDQAQSSGAAILASPIVGTVKRADPTKPQVMETISRERLWQAQTPQAFEKHLLLRAYADFKGQATDDSQVVEAYGHPVDIVQCSTSNLKITTQEDLRLAENILKSASRKNIISEFGVAPSKKAGSLDDLLG